ncbi:hypothetical protein BC938DRAFT_480252 [Jimgerdemannia flammicorona]|uniref:Uncharacterized protein n=1 Tax=Jimgerdemannia flammicorona TaxID=994334 RepID=A0A433QIX1_9FUNG|nr:hypothetical protein BC938DRAFT_480252 [Jimgerdemannia flammicorona]
MANPCASSGRKPIPIKIQVHSGRRGLRKPGLDRSRGSALSRRRQQQTPSSGNSPQRPEDVRHISSHLIANVKLANVATGLTVPHSTGAWHILFAMTKDNYTTLQDGSKFHFELAKEKKVINNEFTFNHMLEVTEPNEKNELVLNLAVRIKDTIGQSYTVNSEQEAIFKGNLKKIAEAFHHEVTTNEATSRNFINPFMVEAVATVLKEYSSTRLAVEEQFDGSRGYSRLDYVMFCNDLAAIVTEAKKFEFQKGITQNIVQLHTAIEVSPKFCIRFIAYL